MTISIISAMSSNGTIGKDNKLPWRLPSDLKRFKAITTNGVVLMGRKTFESIGSKPLPNRYNIVITKSKEIADVYGAGRPSLMVVNSLDAALVLGRSLSELAGVNKEIFVIGGESLYRDCLPLADKMYLTEIHATIEGDIHFPSFNKEEWVLVSQEVILEEKGFLDSVTEEVNISYNFNTYERKKEL